LTDSEAKTRTVYRYDGENYQLGRVIRSRGDHFPGLTDVEKVVEQLVRRTMQDGEHIRSTSLYTWAELEMAESAWRSKREADLYALEVKEEDITFQGDLDFFSDAKAAVAANQSAAEGVARYCNGRIKSDGRRVEVLVREATVIRKLRDASEHLNPAQRLLRRIRGQAE
jgi:hypothetical protein